MKKKIYLIFFLLGGIACAVAAVVFFVPLFIGGIHYYKIIEPSIDFPFWVWWIIGIIFGLTSYGMLKEAINIYKEKSENL